MEERVGRPIRVEITSNRKQKQNKNNKTKHDKTKRHKIIKTIKEQNNSIYTNKQTRQGAVFGIMLIEIWHYIFVFYLNCLHKL